MIRFFLQGFPTVSDKTVEHLLWWYSVEGAKKHRGRRSDPTAEGDEVPLPPSDKVFRKTPIFHESPIQSLRVSFSSHCK